jgi:hypothetical protein
VPIAGVVAVAAHTGEQGQPGQPPFPAWWSRAPARHPARRPRLPRRHTCRCVRRTRPSRSRRDSRNPKKQPRPVPASHRNRPLDAQALDERRTSVERLSCAPRPSHSPNVYPLYIAHSGSTRTWASSLPFVVELHSPRITQQITIRSAYRRCRPDAEVFIAEKIRLARCRLLIEWLDAVTRRTPAPSTHGD